MALLASLVSACATESPQTASRVTTGSTEAAPICRQWRGELNKMDARGVPAQIDAGNAGRKLTAKARADVLRYNQLINDFIAKNCHR